jgi:glycerophosphoryl diester phosphodiesterase
MARALLSLALLLILAAPAAAADNPWLERRQMNIAHQGGELEFPSNTMFAYKRSLEIGADMLELDVNITKDGQNVVMHDTHLGRMCHPELDVNDFTLAELKGRFDPACRDWKDSYAGIATGERKLPKHLRKQGFTREDFQIASLREVLDAFPGTLINIEIKGAAPDHVEAQTFLESTVAGKPTGWQNADALAALLNEPQIKADHLGRVIVVSFAETSIERFHLQAPDYDIATGTEFTAQFWATSQGPLPGASDGRHAAVQPPEVFSGIRVLTEDFVADAHANGLAVHPWTINDAATMEKLLDWGVDGIMTDRPSLLEAILEHRRSVAQADAQVQRAEKRALLLP